MAAVKKSIGHWRRQLRRRLNDQRGATMLEWILLLVVIALPTYAIIQVGLYLLAGHYRMFTTLNGMPFP